MLKNISSFSNINDYLPIFNSVLITIKKHRNRTMTTMKARKDGGMELQEAVMPGVKTVMCWYNMWSEPPA